MIYDPIAAQMALLVMYAEDTFDELGTAGKGNLRPPLDGRVMQGWKAAGYFCGRDALLDTQHIGLGDPVFYGFLAQSLGDATQFIAVVRGTDGLLEWLEDGEFVPMKHPLAGTVESGFYSIYSSLQYIGADGVAGSLLDGIATAVGGNDLTVIGHSLGSTLATYLTLDLAVGKKLGSALSACLFASPRPGDSAFTEYFDQHVGAYKVFNYSLDLVPQVPKFFGYGALPRAREFEPQEAQANIRSSLDGNHHAVCYSAMLNYAAADWTAMPAVDQVCAACILGPNPQVAGVGIAAPAPAVAPVAAVAA
jgi:hypothetical protein